MKTITLRNDFHKTECNVRLKENQTTLTKNQIQRAMKKLCGVSGCQCGGIRGKQDFNWEYSLYTDRFGYNEFETIEILDSIPAMVQG